MCLRFAFLWWLAILSIFLCACWGHLYVFCGKMSIQVSCPFFDWVFFLILSFTSCLYILDTNPLSVISFANIFSHAVGCHFILSTVSFAVQKLLNLIRSHLSIFAFVSFALGDRSKKVLLWFMSKSVLPVFSSRNFVASSLKFRSLIYFEFTFVYGMRKYSNFILY